MVLAFWLCIRPETWEALFPDFRRARARRVHSIPPPSLEEPGLAPAPRRPEVVPVPPRAESRVEASMAAARPREATGTGILWGRVLDERGGPVVGATVGDQQDGEGASYEFARTTVTDASGAWRLEACPAGRHRVRLLDRTEALFEANAPRRARSVFLELATGEIREVEHGAAPHDVTWSGRLRTRDGALFRCGCVVTVRSSSLELERPIGEDATFRWRLPPGSYGVTVAYGRQEFDVDLPGAPGFGTDRSPTEAYVGVARDLDADLVVVAGRVSGKVIASGRIGEWAGCLQFHGGTKPLSQEDCMQGASPPFHAVAADGSFGPVFLPPGRYQVRYVGWVDANEPRLGGGVLLTSAGEPAEIQIVEGTEVAGLALHAPTE